MAISVGVDVAVGTEVVFDPITATLLKILSTVLSSAPHSSKELSTCTLNALPLLKVIRRDPFSGR